MRSWGSSIQKEMDYEESRIPLAIIRGFLAFPSRGKHEDRQEEHDGPCHATKNHFKNQMGRGESCGEGKPKSKVSMDAIVLKQHSII